MKYELTQEQIELICEGLNALAAVTISDQYIIDDQCVIPRNGKHTVSAKAFFSKLNAICDLKDIFEKDQEE